MDGRSHYDETKLTIDLLETLVGRNAVEPERVAIGTVRSWFGADDQRVAEKIIEDLDTDAEAPFVWNPSEGGQGHVYLTSHEETIEFIEHLRKNPPWYE